MKAKRGRPGRKITPGQRVPLGLRVTPTIKRKLDAAARKSGRSQSQEAEFRLERSFNEWDRLAALIRDAVEAAYRRDAP